jgi:tetratricopeptide (TPR) repeat protein
MRAPIFKVLTTAAIAAAMLSTVCFAQAGGDEPKAPETPKRGAPSTKAPAQTPPAAAKGTVLTPPKTAEDRERTLTNLYAHLATAEDEAAAKRAEEAIQRLWSFSGSDTVALLMERGLVAAHAKNYDLALQLFDAVVELAPDFAEGWNQRAFVLYMKGDVQRSLGDLRRTLALDPSHFKALDGLSQILKEIGQKRAALQALRQLLDVHPFWSGARQAAEELAREVDGQGI